jgi:hypothetical protein
MVVTTVLSIASGWFRLASRYPNRPEPTIRQIGSQSGMMGIGVGMRGILVLTACRSGLRVSIWRVFGPFCPPFFVPWGEIVVRSKNILFQPYARLGFGQPEAGVLSIEQKTWDILARSASDYVGVAVAERLPPLSERRMARAFLLEWIASTTFAAGFFYLAPRLDGAKNPIPLSVCVAFPALAFGVAQIVRFLQHSYRR